MFLFPFLLLVCLMGLIILTSLIPAMDLWFQVIHWSSAILWWSRYYNKIMASKGPRCKLDHETRAKRQKVSFCKYFICRLFSLCSLLGNKLIVISVIYFLLWFYTFLCPLEALSLVLTVISCSIQFWDPQFSFLFGHPCKLLEAYEHALSDFKGNFRQRKNGISTKFELYTVIYYCSELLIKKNLLLFRIF